MSAKKKTDEDPEYLNEEVQLKDDLNFVLTEIEIMKNSQKNFLWELNKVHEEMQSKATIQSIIKINSRLQDFTPLEKFEKLSKQLSECAKWEQLYELENEFKSFVNDQKDNAKTWQVEKDIKSAKESIFVSLRKYVKKETYQEQLKDIENKINSSNDGIIKQKVEIERIDRALDLINAKITK